MALITFAPNGLALTNGNLTGTADYSYPLKANQGKSSGKWYCEIKYNSGSYPMIGVAGISTGAGATWTGNLGRYYYHNGTKYPGPIAYGTAMVIGDTIGIAIDLDSHTKTIKFYRNGIPQGIAFSDLHLLEKPMVPYITSGSSSINNNVTANFGASTFDIINKNSGEWDKLIAEGYLPYDIENTVIVRLNVYADKLYIKSPNEKINLTIDSLTFGSGLESIRIDINDRTIYSGSIIYPLPNMISLQLDSSYITQNINTMKIYDGNGVIITKIMNIYLENSLLNPIVRDFINTKVNTMENMQISPGIGTSLNNMTDGNVSLEIPTAMRSKVNKITVDSDSDKILNANGVYPLTNIDQYLYKTPIILNNGNRLLLNNYITSNSDIIRGRLDKDGKGILITDGNDITYFTRYGYSGSSTMTFSFSTPHTISAFRFYGTTDIYVKTSFYDINDILIKEVTYPCRSIATNNAMIKIEPVSGVSKIVFYESGGGFGNVNIYSMEVFGESEKINHVYKSNEYLCHSPLNILSSKLIIENNTSPIDSTLVKSKKMGNLAFINNSSKLVLKKYDSSIDNPSSKIVRSKIVLSNKIPIRRIEIK